jgi:hypothetical protein
VDTDCVARHVTSKRRCESGRESDLYSPSVCSIVYSILSSIVPATLNTALLPYAILFLDDTVTCDLECEFIV